MKITTLMMIIVFFGSFAVIGFLGMANDLDDAYDDNQINTSKWDAQFDKTAKINKTLNPTIQALRTMADPERGWLTRLGSGLIAIPYAIINFISLSFDTIATTVIIITVLGVELAIPPGVILAMIVMFSIWGISKLVGMVNKTADT